MVPKLIFSNLPNSDGKNKLKSFWTKVEGVLICDDEQLKETAIKDAQHIIHYSVPVESFRAFVSRLSTMLDNFTEAKVIPSELK